MADARPDAAEARLVVLHDGYAGRTVASTVSYVEDGDARVVVDPGMVASPDAILGPLLELGCAAPDITDVVISHHHPDHTRFVGLFPRARLHDHWAVYEGDVWTARPAEGFAVSPSVRLIETPGHTPQDITTLVATPDGIAALTHLWWHADGPEEDPLAWDGGRLHEGRARVLELASRIVPGHGPPFDVTPATPR